MNDWPLLYEHRRQLDADRWLVAFPLAGFPDLRGRVAVATWDGITGDFY